jgi:hypothetical protein
MPHILSTFDFTPREPGPLNRFALMLRKLYEQLARVLNGLVSFGNGLSRDNIDGEWAAVADTGAANTDFTITHNMLRIPVGWIPMNQTKSGVLYKGAAAWTTTTITLKCNVANDNILIFIV